jgi:hypothetical protein
MPKRILPIVSGAGAPEPGGGAGQEDWARGATFLEFVEAAGEHRAEIEAAFRDADVPPEVVEFFASYPRQVRVAALAEATLLDARYNVAQAERLFTCGGRIWMRIFAPERHADLVQRWAPQAELPQLVFLAQDMRAFASWGPRPRALQHLPNQDLAERSRIFYEANRGCDLARELRAILEPHDGTTR